MELEGRVAVVTGGGGAIGSAIARRFDAAGARVAVADLRFDAAEAVARELARTALRLDVTSSVAWSTAVDQVLREHGRLDVLVNNAATHVQALVEEMTDDEWDRVITTNTSSVFYGCRAVIPPMRAAGAGSIINIVTGQFGVAYSSAYTSSKFLVRGFSQCLMLKVARYGIRVNCIAPGAIPNTGFEPWYREKAALVGQDYDTFLEGALDAIPLRRFGTPEEIAAGALYLASDEGAYVNGHLLAIDGGFAGYASALVPETS